MSSKGDQVQDKNVSAEKERKAKEKADRKAAFEAKLQADLVKKNEMGNKEGKSKAQLRKERRALQEVQRAMKDDHKPGASTESTKPVKTEEPVKKEVKIDPVGKTKEEKALVRGVHDLHLDTSKSPETGSSVKATGPSTTKVNKIYASIPRRHPDIDKLIKGLGHNGLKIHPIFIKLGLKMNRDIIRGNLPRCAAFLHAIRQVIVDYVTPPRKEFIRDLITKLKQCKQFLAECRPLTVGMVNAFDYIQFQATKISPEKNDTEAKRELLFTIDEYLRNEISLALQAIAQFGRDIIKKDGDCILTLNCSLKVQHIFYAAHLSGKHFKVIVVDTAPEFRGLEMVKFLSQLDIPVSYVYVNAVPYVLPEATKVFLSAYAVLANSHVMADMGTSQVALLARTHNVPIYMCCETSEFSDDVYTDAFVYNEALPQGDYFKKKHYQLEQCFDKTDHYESKLPRLRITSLMHDVTPPELVDVVITEKGVLPVSAVQPVMRRHFTQKAAY
ncbi:Translation initiation factor eIF-2B subunit delta [Halotydeus destructor]|nr:Translation initiation factor eIF-2B subunit delta [Halotydeus destructor]